MPPGTYRIALVMLSNRTATPQHLIEVVLTQQSCATEYQRILSDVRAETIPNFSTYTPKFSWNCRHDLPQLFDGGGELGGKSDFNVLYEERYNIHSRTAFDIAGMSFKHLFQEHHGPCKFMFVCICASAYSYLFTYFLNNLLIPEIAPE